MSSWMQGDVSTNGMRMHYYRTGGDKPPLVLCHGFSDNGLCWTRVADALEADYDVIMIDARGHGLSDAPEGEYGPQAMAADVAGLIEALELGRPMVMGHSMGGATTLNLAADYPELVSRAILEDAGAYQIPAPTDDAPQRNNLAVWAEEMQSKTLEEIMAMGREDSPEWDEIEFGPWAAAKLQLRAEAMGVRARPRPPWREVFGRVQCPLLLITADNDKGAIVTPENAAEAARINDKVEVVHIPGAGHNVRREQFEPFMDAVREFLDRG